MEKNAIVILTGSAEGKNAFKTTAMDAGYWTWNINPKNTLGVASRSMGWKGKRNEKYYAYLEELSALVNKYWEFDLNYFVDFIRKFNEDSTANLLIIHQCDSAIAEKLCDEYGAITIHTDKETSKPPICDKFIPLNGSFKDTVLSVLRILVS